MSTTVTLQSAELETDISTHGAELQSLRRKNGMEYLWQGDADVWSGRSPILFPICGGLKDGMYVFDGRKYKLEKHGFAKKLDFKLESQNRSRAVFLLCESEDTLISYPFRFDFRVCYELDGKKLTVTYDIKNKSEKTMYFSCGAHEGFALPCGVNGCKIMFEKPESLNSCKVADGILSSEYEKISENSQLLSLNEDYFKEDALIFKELASRSVTLVNDSGDRRIRVDFEDFDHLLLWQVCGAKFLCIEPWTGLPDIVGSDYELTRKESITPLEAGKSVSYTHHITILD